jgi:hypothetical protein
MQSSTPLAHQRLVAQGIAVPRSVTAAEIVTRLGAVQAQDYPGALWSIALRMTGATRANVERAIVERAIVRTWPMRGTLHFVPAADARWMLELLTPRIVKSAAGRHRQLELDDAAFHRSMTLIGRALAERRMLSRSALFDVLERGGVSTVRVDAGVRRAGVRIVAPGDTGQGCPDHDVPVRSAQGVAEEGVRRGGRAVWAISRRAGVGEVGQPDRMK